MIHGTQVKARSFQTRGRGENHGLSRAEMEQVLGAFWSGPWQGKKPPEIERGDFSRFTEEELGKLLGLELTRFVDQRSPTGCTIPN